MSKMIRNARRDRIGRAALFVVWLGLVAMTGCVAALHVSPMLEPVDLSL